jgi:hypothetical protein
MLERQRVVERRDVLAGDARATRWSLPGALAARAEQQRGAACPGQPQERAPRRVLRVDHP